MTAKRYQRWIIAAIAALSLIIVTGAAVRLSESGLGCEDWPTCNEDSITPEWEAHGLIEFGNRLLSGVVGLAVCVAVLGAYKRSPRQQNLVTLAWGLVIGVVAQILLGAMTVWADLNPAVVGLHFVLSLLLLTNAVMLLVQNQKEQPLLPQNKQTIFLFGLATIVFLLGVVVTGTGPNSGDARATRLPFDLEMVARLHGVAVWVFIATLLYLYFKAKDNQSQRKQLGAVAGLSLVQGLIGYVQYTQGVPPEIVIFHIIGAVAVWLATCVVCFSDNETSSSGNNP